MKRLLSITLLAFVSIAGYAWSTIGHEVIVEIAKRHFTQATRDSIARYMPYDITKDARWMDKHRRDPELLYMFHFHEMCINLETLEYDPNAQIDKGDMMHGLWLSQYNLSHRKHLTDSIIVLNVRMMIHFIGDLHCPVHVGIPGIWFPKPPYRQDIHKWYWKGTKYQSFHSFIDKSPKLLFPGKNSKEIAELIDNGISHSKVKAWTKGDFVAWTNDSARRGYRIYKYYPPLWEIPDTPEPKYIPDDFLDNTRDIMVEELLKAGYQLAKVLNTCFAK